MCWAGGATWATFWAAVDVFSVSTGPWSRKCEITLRFNGKIQEIHYEWRFEWMLMGVLMDNLDLLKMMSEKSPRKSTKLGGSIVQLEFYFLVVPEEIQMVIITMAFISGWWFGTWIFWLSIQLGSSSSQLTNSIIFQRARLKPPTRFLRINYWLMFIIDVHPFLIVIPSGKLT